MAITVMPSASSIGENTLIITSERDVNKLISNTHQLVMQQDRFVISTASRLIESDIVDVIHEKMRKKNYSRKIIDSTFLSTRASKNKGSSDISFDIISNYISETGFPVAVMRERGRSAYVVFAKPPTKSRPNPHLSYIVNGVRIFRKKSKIPRMPASNIIKDTVLKNTPKVQKKLNKAYKAWIRSVLRSRSSFG